MLRVQAEGLSCWSDSCRTQGHAAILLSLFGHRNAVRALWARFFNSKIWTADLRVGLSQYRRIEAATYHTIQAPMPRAQLHVIIVHTLATRQASPFSESFFQVGPEPQERFFEGLTRRCKVPLRPSWREAIWALGLEHGLITPLDGHGLSVHQVQTGEAWTKVVQQALQEGKIC